MNIIINKCVHSLFIVTLIRGPKEAVDIQSEYIVVSGMVHL